jgi:hypothetical protein
MSWLKATALIGVISFSGSAFAANQVWNITEVAVEGAQGRWLVTIDPGNNLSGTTEMQFDTGAPLSYSLEGSINNDAYNIKLIDRSDGKKDCISTGNIYLNADNKTHKVIGEVRCSGEEKFYIRGGY